MQSMKTVFSWGFMKYYNEMSVGVCFSLFLIIIMLSLIFGKNKTIKQMALFNFVSYFLYFIAVCSGLYAYGDFGKRYSLFFIPMWMMLGIAAYYDILRCWDEKGKTGMLFISDLKNVFIGISLCSLICFGIFNWSAILRDNWTKEDIRGAVEEWFSWEGPETETLVYHGANSGFAYYIRQNEWYSEWMEQKVHYMKSVTMKERKECEQYIDGLYGTEWPEEFYFVASHIGGDFKVIMECFTSKGYLAEDIFDMDGGKLVYLKQK